MVSGPFGRASWAFVGLHALWTVIRYEAHRGCVELAECLIPRRAEEPLAVIGSRAHLQRVAVAGVVR